MRHLAVTRYQWTCWTLAVSLFTFMVAIAASVMSDALFVGAYFVSTVTLWAYFISIGRLAKVLHRSPITWSGLSILSCGVGGHIVAFCLIRSIYLRQARQHNLHNGAPPMDAPKGNSGQSRDETSQQNDRNSQHESKQHRGGDRQSSQFDPRVSLLLEGAVQMMDVTRADCKRAIRARLGGLPLEQRDLLELAALDIFAVVHATHPIIGEIASNETRQEALVSLIGLAAELWERRFANEFSFPNPQDALTERLKAYEAAFIEGFNHHNGPFWEVAKQLLRYCGRDQSAVHALAAHGQASLKFKHVVELLNELAMEPATS